MKTIPMDERAIREQDVFGAFDLTAPGLEGVRSALDAGNLSSAKENLVHYLETRAPVRFFYDYRTLPLQKMDTDSNPHDFQASLGLSGSLKEFCLFAGRHLMENVYVRPGRDRTIIDLGPDYENLPHFNFLTDQGKKQRTLSDILVRGQFFEYLAVLYHETGDKKVLEKFEEVLRVFLKEYPLVLEYTEPDASRFCLTEDRDVMSTGWLVLTYIGLFYTRIPYEISTDAAFSLIARIWFLGMQFRRFDTDAYRPYNHHMWERGLVPFLLGTLLPEIPDFAAMREKGAEVTRRHIKEDFNEAGGYNEHSIPYWSGAALSEMIYKGVYLSRINGVPLLDKESEARLDRTFTALALISPPQPLYSSIGDNGGPMVEPILRIGAKATGNAACTEVLALRREPGQERTDAAPLDFCNDRCGFVASRSGFGEDANFVLMSAKVDCADSGHNHMDMLSLFLTVRGQEFIGEPHARQLYQRNRMASRHRGYLYNMGSHNTVLAYGEPIQSDAMYANKWGVYRPDSPVSAFQSTDAGCYFEAYHDAYTTCRHRRGVLFHRSAGFLIRDSMEHGNRLPEPHIQRWHLLPDAVCRPFAENALILEKNGVCLLLLWPGSPQLAVWKKEDLVPEIVRENEPLSTVIDAAFSAAKEHPEDIATVSQTLLVLDITGRDPQTLRFDALEEAALAIQPETGLADALNRFGALLD